MELCKTQEVYKTVESCCRNKEAWEIERILRKPEHHQMLNKSERELNYSVQSDVLIKYFNGRSHVNKLFRKLGPQYKKRHALLDHTNNGSSFRESSVITNKAK